MLAQRDDAHIAMMSTECLKITGGLCPGEGSERQGFARNGDIGMHPFDELEEDVAVWASFMKLAGGVKISRTVAGRGRHMIDGDQCLS